jgi:hypothetical protein
MANILDGTPGDGVAVGFVGVPSLGAGASLARSGVVNVPMGLAAGAYLLSAVADVDGAIPELAGNDGAVVNGRVAARAVNVLPPAP